MVDIYQLWGGDLSIAATGDLAVAFDDGLAQQRILRRLLTSAGDYIWQLSYGAGLPAMVGSPQQVYATKALIRSQIFSEASVARTPEPVISVVSDQMGSVYVNILYVDAASSATQTLSFPVGK